MKKIISAILLMATCLVFITSCGTLDAAKATEKLEKEGCTVVALGTVDEVNEKFKDMGIKTLTSVTNALIADETQDYVIVFFCNNEKNAGYLEEELEEMIDNEETLKKLFGQTELVHIDDYKVDSKKNVVAIGHEFLVDTAL